jgi:hypothetical protein
MTKKLAWSRLKENDLKPLVVMDFSISETGEPIEIFTQ